MERLRVTVSFKHTKKDIELYEWVNEFDDKSYLVKTILREYYDKIKADEEAEKRAEK